MELEKRKNFLINTAYWALIALISLGVIRYILPISLPFVFGFLFAYLVILIARRFRLENRWARLLMAIVLYVTMGFLVGFLTAKSISLVSQLADWLPKLYAEHIQPLTNRAYVWVSAFLDDMDPTVASLFTMISGSLSSALSKLVSVISTAAVNLISSAATGVPATLVSIIVMMFSTFFAVVDCERIREFSENNLPDRWKQVLGTVREYLTGTLFVVLRSYLLIMLLTFTELAVLFALFGIQHPVVKASLIAVLDILPLLGTGGIMIPWAVISMVMGNLGMGLKLLLIYAIVTFIRNYVEPKIVGVQLGLHPIITLVSMFLGLRLFGFLGIFGLPLAISFFWKQHKAKAEARAAQDPAPAE